MQPPNALSQPEVIGLLRNKLARNPGDLDSALQLGSVLYQSGDPKSSAEALRQALAHHPDHHQTLLLLARAEARSGDSKAALATFARAQQVKPDDEQSWKIAAALAAELREWSELQRIGSGWTQAMQNSVAAWQALARAYFEESSFADAASAFSRVLELEPDKAEHLISAARMAIAAQDYDLARRYLESAEQLAPESADLLFAFCRWLHLTGELDTAKEYCERAIAARPGFIPAYVELGILRQGWLEEPELQVVKKLFSDPGVHPEYQCMLGFTLGEALDRKGNYAQAFAAWDQANEISRSISEREGFIYQPKQFENELELLPALYSALIEQVSIPTASSEPRPIFVLGMPRSGTTLVESILASHSQVMGAGELPTLYDIHEELLAVARQHGIESAQSLIRVEASNWRQRYLSALPNIHDAESVVDKQPLNFRSIGLIRLLFPESPIFYLRRQPIDVGLSIYRHKFSKSWPCAHRLRDIGHYYGIHARILEYWTRRYPDSISVIDYSELVAEPETTIPGILTRAKLDFESACLKPHETKRSVATFSAVQVRDPVSTKFSNRSARYAAYLKPLRDALADAGIGVGDR